MHQQQEQHYKHVLDKLLFFAYTCTCQGVKRHRGKSSLERQQLSLVIISARILQKIRAHLSAGERIGCASSSGDCCWLCRSMSPGVPAPWLLATRSMCPAAAAVEAPVALLRRCLLRG